MPPWERAGAKARNQDGKGSREKHHEKDQKREPGGVGCRQLPGFSGGSPYRARSLRRGRRRAPLLRRPGQRCRAGAGRFGKRGDRRDLTSGLASKTHAQDATQYATIPD
jgi:hypothetical protein